MPAARLQNARTRCIAGDQPPFRERQLIVTSPYVKWAVSRLTRALASNTGKNILCMDRNISEHDTSMLRIMSPDINWIPYRSIVRRFFDVNAMIAPHARGQRSYITSSNNIAADFAAERELHYAILSSGLQKRVFSGILTGNFDYHGDEALRQLADVYDIPIFVLTKEFPLNEHHKSAMLRAFLAEKFPDRGDIALLANKRANVYVEAGSVAVDRCYVTGLPRFDGYSGFAPWRVWLSEPRMTLRSVVHQAPYAYQIHRTGKPANVSGGRDIFRRGQNRLTKHSSKPDVVRLTLLDFGDSYGSVAGRYFDSTLWHCQQALMKARSRVRGENFCLTIKCRTSRDASRIMQHLRTRHDRPTIPTTVSVTEHLPTLFHQSEIVVGYNSTALIEAALTGTNVLALTYPNEPASSRYLNPSSDASTVVTGVHPTDIHDLVLQHIGRRYPLSKDRVDASWDWAAEHVLLPVENYSLSQQVSQRVAKLTS